MAISIILADDHPVVHRGIQAILERESDFSIVPPESVELWKNTGIASKAEVGASSGTNTRDDNAELWWWVLALLAVLAVAESVLGNRQMSVGKETA